MQITLLKSKLHHANVTHSELAIDGALLEAANISEYEQIQIYNLNNGERFTTYAIRAEDHSGIISVNGAAAHKASPGDRIIICTYAVLSQQEATAFKPTLIYLDSDNRIKDTRNAIPVQVA
jgi:aspartate 1-decarboxylase